MSFNQNHMDDHRGKDYPDLTMMITTMVGEGTPKKIFFRTFS